MIPQDPRRTWRTGFVVLLVVPFLGLISTLADPPRWLQVSGLVVMLVLVWAGVALMSRRTGGWRPSETLARPGRDEH